MDDKKRKNMNIARHNNIIAVNERIEKSVQEKEEMERIKNIDIASLKEVYKFPLLYQGWECDEWGYIKEDESGKRYIVLTDHGSAYISDEAGLQEYLSTYKNAIDCINKAHQMLIEGK